MTSESSRPFAVLLVSHGSFASALLHTAQRIAGDFPDAFALDLDWDSPGSEIEHRVREQVAALRADHGAVLVLTELHGSTPTRAACAVSEPGRVEVIAGANLPMVVRLACRTERSSDVARAARRLADRGRDCIRLNPVPPVSPAGKADPCGEDS